MSQQTNYGETLCESVKIIAESVLEGISFDQTIKCTVKDDSRAGQGEYRVANDSASFLAYAQGSEKYRNNDNVYVLIPQGDYNNKKLIIGKASYESEGESGIYDYIDPLAQFLPIYNAIPSPSLGLVANGSITQKEAFADESFYDADGNVSLFTEDCTRLSISAEFKTALNMFDCVSGEYGVKLIISHNSRTASDQTQETVLYLNTDDMFGNPYNFSSSGFTQKKIFDISGLGQIHSIKGILYQIPGTFKNSQGGLVPYDYPDILENIILLNLQIGIGYDTSAFDGEYVQLYTLNTKTYNKNADLEKNISMIWIHEDENGKKIVVNNDNFPSDYEIRWYRYKFNAAAADNFSGVCWERVDEDDEKSLVKKIELTPNEASEQIKAIIVYGKEPSVIPVEEVTKEQVMLELHSYYKDEACANLVNLLSDFDEDGSNKDTLWYKEPDKRVAYTSNILTFTNQDYTINPLQQDLLNGLTLQCYETNDNGEQIPSPGVYLLYDSFGNIINDYYSTLEYKIKCSLNLTSISSDDGSGKKPIGPEEFTSIKWYFPVDAMITVPGYVLSSDKEFIGEIDTLDQEVRSELAYKINKKYYPLKSDNWIRCEVEYQGITYSATQQLYFGYEGTMGSACSAQILLEDFDQPAFTMSNDIQTPTLKLQVFDEYFNDISVELQDQVSWFLLEIPEYTGITEHQANWLKLLYSSEDNVYKLQFNKPGDFYYGGYVVKALVDYASESAGRKYTIEVYQPISLRSGTFTARVPNKVVYSTSGTPSFKQGALKSWPKEIKWNVRKSFLPEFCFTIDEQNRLHPPEMFVKQINKTYQQYVKDGKVVCEEVDTSLQACILRGTDDYLRWKAPIIAYQNKYFSSTIDDWSGTGVQISDGGGYILSNMVAAGSKNASNQFSGVVMGDWAAKDSPDLGQTGLYGFGAGEMAFAFKDDGTAFIGKSGKGRIEFDGERGIIRSAGFNGNSDETGTKIDLDDTSIILQQGATDVSNYVYADSTEYVEGHRVLEPETTSNSWKNGLLAEQEYKNYKENNIPLYEKSGSVYNPIDFDNYTYKDTQKYYRKDYAYRIRLDALEDVYPMKIGTASNPKFKVHWDGSIEASGADIKGHLEADTGYIGGWEIGTDVNKRLQSKNGNVFLDPSGTIFGSAIKVGNTEAKPDFWVDDDGNLGIGYFGDSTATTATLDNDNYKFFVKNNGQVIARDLTLYNTSGIKLDYRSTSSGSYFNIILDSSGLQMGRVLSSSDSPTIYYHCNISNGGLMNLGYNGTDYNFELDSSGKLTLRGTLAAGEIQSSTNNNRIKLKGYLDVYDDSGLVGTFGLFSSKWESGNTTEQTTGIGLDRKVYKYNDDDAVVGQYRSTVKATGTNVGMSYVLGTGSNYNTINEQAYITCNQGGTTSVGGTNSIALMGRVRLSNSRDCWGAIDPNGKNFQQVLGIDPPTAPEGFLYFQIKS